ncbi:MAG: type II secretion system F family protein [Opitutaceae bacterium]
MPDFNYKARQKDGQIKTGSIEANDRRQATQRLQEQGLSPVTLKQQAASKPSPFKNILKSLSTSNQPKQQSDGAKTDTIAKGKSPKRERIGLTFLKRLMELHASGLPIGDSIRILSQRLSDPEQKELANQLWRDLSEGHTLASALARQPKYFSGSITYVIEAGEATGSLAPILHKVIDYLEEKQAIRQKVIASMAYPAFICFVAFVVVIIFLLVLLPEIQAMLEKLGGEMTMSARILIDGSDYLLKFGPFILVAGIIASFAIKQWRATPKGQSTTDSWALKLPLLGKIFYYSDLFQCGNLVSTLLESGINTTETLNLTERTIKNTDLRERFHKSRAQVNEGLSVAQAFKRNEFMPDLAIDILSVGENTGNLAHSMTEITKGFRIELSKRLTALTNIVATGALIFAFCLVALIAIGIVTSVFQVSKTLSM